jgi:hypothetical protein
VHPQIAQIDTIASSPATSHATSHAPAHTHQGYDTTECRGPAVDPTAPVRCPDVYAMWDCECTGGLCCDGPNQIEDRMSTDNHCGQNLISAHQLSNSSTCAAATSPVAPPSPVAPAPAPPGTGPAPAPRGGGGRQLQAGRRLHQLAKVVNFIPPSCSLSLFSPPHLSPPLATPPLYHHDPPLSTDCGRFFQRWGPTVCSSRRRV